MTILTTAREIMDKGLWTEFCNARGWDYYIVRDGILSADFNLELSLEEWKIISGEELKK